MWSRRNGETLWLRQPTAMARRLPNILEWNLFRTLNCIEPAQILGLIQGYVSLKPEHVHFCRNGPDQQIDFEEFLTVAYSLILWPMVLTHVLFADDVPISDPPVLDWGKFALLQVRRSLVADVSGSCHRCTTFGRRKLRYFWTLWGYIR